MTTRPLPEGLHLDTLAVRAAVDKSQYGENSEALYLSSSFTQPDCETAARRFAGEEEGYIYSRFTNPTTASMEKRLAAMEGTEACIAAASGMGAILLLCMGLLKAGDHVLCSRSVFGSTIKLIGSEFGKFGVESTFVSQTDLAEWKETPEKFAQRVHAVRRLKGDRLAKACATMEERYGATFLFCTPEESAEIVTRLVLGGGAS